VNVTTESMTAMHHPSQEILLRFARRELSVGASVIVSAHIERCSECRDRVAELESRQLLEWGLLERDSLEWDQATSGKPSFDAMIADIVRQPRCPPIARTTRAAKPRDRFFKDARLPRSLRQAAGGLRWQRVADGVHQAKVAIDSEANCKFLHMAAGASAPSHGHFGREYTLVLQGSFHDEQGCYRDGDFLCRDDSDEHRPASDHGCLCFAVLDRPLRFTEGLPKLLNPFNRLFSRNGSKSSDLAI